MAGDSSDNNDKEFQVITSALDDCRRLIAAGKVQRWDVVKWGVTVNTALGGAAATPALGHNFSLAGLAGAVSIAGLLLVGHYNRRMTGARETAIALTKRLNSKFKIDYDAITKAEAARTNGFWRYLSALKPPLTYSAGEYYDWQELWIFSAILVVSPFLVLLVLSAH